MQQHFTGYSNNKVNKGNSNSSASHCITDQPFWADVLKPKAGHCLENPLAILLPVMEGYAADANDYKKNGNNNNTAAAHSKRSQKNRKQRPITGDVDADFASSTDDEEEEHKKKDNEPFADDYNTNKNGPSSASATPESGGGPAPISHMGFEGLHDSPLSLSLLQHVLMYMVPMDHARYIVPAMSSSWSSTAVVERGTNRVVTHGSVAPPAVSGKVQYKSIVCGDTFIALLTTTNEVQVAGQLETPPSQMSSGSDPQVLRTMGSNRIKMLTGQSSKLLALTTAHTVRPLSVVPANTKTIIPYRLCKYLATALGDDCYMVGFDNILYKTTASQRALGTPRRVMTMSKVGVSRVAAGCGFLIVIDLCGRVYTMGKNKRGQLGNDKRQESMRKPYLHAHLQHHFFVNAAAGDLHSIILASNGVAYAAGCNAHGQLGLGRDVPDALTFTRVPLPARCTSVAAGPSASMFACADGKVYVCGFNEMGMLGVDNAVNRAEKIIFRPMALGGITNGAAEMVLDNFSLSHANISGKGYLVGGGGPGGGGSQTAVSGVMGGGGPGLSGNGGAGGNAPDGGLGSDKGVHTGMQSRGQKDAAGCCCVTM